MTKMIKKNWKQTLWKTINVISSVALVANMSMIGVFVAPKVASATVTPTYCPSGNPLYMWDRTPNISWSHGQISGYFEGEYIPVQLELDGLTAGVTSTLRVEHQYIRDSVVGIERLDHVNAPVEPGLAFNADRLNFSMSSATIVPGNPSLKQYTLTFTPTGSTATLYFDALIGPNAHLYNGASLHVSLPDCGSKDVPIAVNQILYHSLSITKSDNPDPIQLNANTTYTITATNNGKTDGGEKNFTVTDTLPAGMAYVNGSATPAPTSVVGQVITWNFGTVADGTIKTITYQATGTAVGTHTNTASVTADGTTPVTTTEPTTVLGRCALVITKSVENYTHPNGPNEPGDLLKYTLNFQNTGSADCTGGGVRVDDTIPANTTYANWHDQSSNVAFGYTYSDFGGANPTGFNGTLLSWNAGTLTPGESGWVKFKVQINKVDACQNVDITNKGIIYADQIPSGVWSNEVTTNVATPCTYCGDGIKQTPNDTGQNEECDGTDGTPDHYICTNECTLEYVPYCGDGIVNQTSEQCDDGNTVDTDACSNQCQTQTCDLVITKSVNKQNAVSGDTLTYTLEYQNNGSMICTGTGVKIYDPLDSRLTYVADTKAVTINNDGEGDGFSPTEGSNYTGHDGNTLLFNVRRVSPGESGTITFDVTVNDSFECGHTIVPNKGKIWSDQTGYIWSNEVTTDMYKACYGSLKVIKYVDTGSATASEWSFTVDGTTLSPVSGENYVIFNDLFMGEYSATESDLAGYHQVSTTCTDVQVNPDETAVCEFHNAHDTGELTINKALDTDGDEQVDVTNPAGWTYDINSVSPDYDMGTTQTVLTGTYTVNEHQHADFHSLGWTCTDGTSGTGEQLTVDVTTGNVACTFTNSRDTATVIVNKFVQLPEGDPIYNPADWSWSLDGSGSYPGGHVEILDTNVTYTVAEDTSIYSSDDFSTTWICWDGDSIYAQGSGTSFDVTPTYHRQSIVCTFTNTRDTTDITFDKVVVGGDHADSAWAFAVDGQGAYHDGDSVTLPTNETFTVTESSQYDALYTMTNAWGACELDNGAIKLYTDGRDNTCYVENSRDTGNIRIKKYNDLNGNGTKDSGEPYMTGWYFEISQNDVVLASGTTGEDGDYLIVENLPTGTYQVTETPQAGWANTEPGTTPIVQDVEVYADATTSVWFGNFKLGFISGYKFNDLNGNGVWDNGEPGLPSWKIMLDNGSYTYTDSNGYYSFTGLTAGTYVVSEKLPDGWTQTMPSVPGTHTVNIQSGTISEDNNFGNFDNIDITVCKYVDANGDGFLTDEQPYMGWDVYLGDNMQATGENGCYTYTDIGPGTYDVTEDTTDTAWIQTYPQAGSYHFSAESGQDQTFNFGNYELGTISGYKYNDVNQNGIWDDGEPGLSGWTITLGGDGSASAVTDENGYYAFTDLLAGTYSLSETMQDGWIMTQSPADVEIYSGVDSTHNDFGNFNYGKISGYKMDQNENGLEGWQICLTKQGLAEFSFARFDAIQEPNCTYTDEEGYYEFNNLMYGTYIVSETQQFGWVQLYPEDPNTHTVDVISGTDSQHNDFMNRMNEFSVSIEKSAPATVNAGANITYTLDWAVTGNTDVYNATVTDPLPANTTFVSADNGGTYDGNTNTVTWDLGTVTPDDSGTVTLVVKTAIPLDNGTVIENTGEVCGTGYIVSEGETELFDENGVTKCDSSTTTTTTESAPILGISKTNDKPVGEPGDRVNYTITWSVDGNSKATNVTITDTIPAELVLDTATISNGGTYNASTRVITWNLGTKVPYASGTVTYSGNFVTSLANGSHVVNVTKITSAETDPKFWEAESVSVIHSGPVLGITKVVTPTETVAGAQVTYTVVIKNTGNDTAVNVKMTDLLPVGFTFDEFGGSSHTFTLGNLAAGAQTTVTYKVNIGASVTPGKYDNLAVASADNHPNVSAKATVTIGQVLGEEALPILSITKTADAEFINPGGHVTYHVTITNTGDAPAINVQLQDVMPAGFTFDVGGITKVWSLGDLAAGASIKVAYTAIADQTVLPGDYENIAVAWADNADKVTASAPVEVRQVQVLGAELPETGAGAMDYAYFFAAGLLLAFSLFLLKLTFGKETEQ
ncbi:MAG: SdrD B-like domain-containing protein [Patescibacteria group bacterium]